MEVIKKTIICNTLDTKDKLKVYAVYEDLDYLGRIIETTYIAEIPYKFDSVDFLDYTIKYGTIKGYKKPFIKSYMYLMENFFNIQIHEEVWRPVLVETETICNTAKFVFYKHNYDTSIMEWEDIKV